MENFAKNPFSREQASCLREWGMANRGVDPRYGYRSLPRRTATATKGSSLHHVSGFMYIFKVLEDIPSPTSTIADAGSGVTASLA
jgi:hypothetical protein